jgi:predicted AlkP superfamily phosphohydrolase/phosphomutase
VNPLIVAGDHAPPQSPAGRPLPATAKRILIVGLDGATFDVLDPLMARGLMPQLATLVDSGVRGVLHSTTPPITPAAWTTFLTGKQPGLHGVLDFERYDPTTNLLQFNSTMTVRHVRNLWTILSEVGLRVGSINVPMTYPAFPVNGFLISGFETPGRDGDFVYPRDLKPDILERWPDPTLRAKWRHGTLRGRRTFQANVDYVEKSFGQAVAMTRYCGDRFGWDVLMTVLKLVDNLQHKTWKYLDRRWSDRDPDRTRLVERAFHVLDNAIAEFVEYAKQHEASLWIVSDHGHGSLEGKVQPNLLLHQWGYLALREGSAQGATRMRYLWDRFRGRTKKFARVGDLSQDLAVDLAKTRACVMHAGMAGFLYINLMGRQPNGIVKPADYEQLRDELRARFLGPECQALDPNGKRIPLFETVHKPEELYGCTRAEQPWMPDLMLMPHRSLAVVRRIRGRQAVQWLPYRRLEGTHRPEGVFIAAGPGIAKGGTVSATLADCAPTLLAALGLRVPADMQGRVIGEMFSRPPRVEKESAPKSAAAPAEADVYSERDLQRVTERLSNLGYLE